MTDDHATLLAEVKLTRAMERLARKDDALHSLAVDTVRLRLERDAALDRVRRLESAFDGIRSVHRPIRSRVLGTDFCGACSGRELTPWPCELAAAAERALNS